MPIIPAGGSDRVTAAVLLLLLTNQASGTIGGTRSVLAQYKELLKKLNEEGQDGD